MRLFWRALGLLLRGFIGLTLALGALSLILYWAVRWPLPRRKGRLRLRGLRGEVQIIRDRWGVPHIYAQELSDLFFAMGFVQAQDRFWQMELNRLIAAGEMSERFGRRALEIDRLTRRIGFRRVARREWEEMTDEEKRLLEAYSDGVNAYLEGSRLPLEFVLLRYRPRPWRPLDTLTLARFINWGLAGNWDGEILRSWTIERFGPEVAAELNTDYPTGKPVTVPPGAEARGSGLDPSKEFAEIAGLISASAALSNQWVVNGGKSSTGKPLLANDPHLTLTMPGIWHEMHLESPDARAAGAGIPGIPGVIIGHNERIAWGITAALADGDDLFVERLHPRDGSQYQYQDGWEQGELVEERIAVRGEAMPVVEEVLITRHGPVISPCIPGEERVLALRTVGMEHAMVVRGLLLLMQAGSWPEFREAARHWPGASVNLAYADVDGNIGYQMAGLVPIRAKGHGLVPAPGWTGDYEWQGFVPFEELPHSLNPQEHWLANANNKPVDEDYPYFLSASYADSPRMERIVQLLTAKEKLSVRDFRAMQMDVLSLTGKDLAGWILGLEAKDDWTRRAQTFVRAWNFELSADSVAAAITQTFFVQLLRQTLEEKLGDWAEFYLGRPVHPLRKGGDFFGNAASWLSRKVREEPRWFVSKSWREAMEEA
ncbi:MAG TPA: penicillin acylase family protein, partial [Dehalococcoidia bacterium]|nr:penicillin acylase family protein [Dehalococcoidia bacterium]